MTGKFTHFHFEFVRAALALVFTSVLAACATIIPETDTELPEVRLTISGPGLGREEKGYGVRVRCQSRLKDLNKLWNQSQFPESAVECPVYFPK